MYAGCSKCTKGSPHFKFCPVVFKEECKLHLWHWNIHHSLGLEKPSCLYKNGCWSTTHEVQDNQRGRWKIWQGPWAGKFLGHVWHSGFHSAGEGLNQKQNRLLCKLWSKAWSRDKCPLVSADESWHLGNGRSHDLGWGGDAVMFRKLTATKIQENFIS